MTKMILTLNEDLALLYDDNGYTPLHLAAITGKAKILEVFKFMAPTSFQSVTAKGETVFHLTVRYNQFDTFMWLVNFSNSSLINRRDQHGCTILHLAVSGKHYQLAEYIINETSVDINHQNNRGHTVLDILNRAGNTWEIQHLKAMLEKAGGKTTIEHALLTPEVKEINHHPPTLESHRDVLDEDFKVSFKSGVEDPELEHELPTGLNRRHNAGRKGSISRRMATTATTADIKIEDQSDSYSDAYSEGSSGYHAY
ncbi:hypothetical protein L1049_003947 [Liquidambar formosana]|uniref:Uncharacterized protein n=1 Tax=Liquidambar formosana TaxID=63359 RepID=A0AAP0RNJ1_LIQFO